MNNFDRGLYGMPSDLLGNPDDYMRGQTLRAQGGPDGKIVMVFLAVFVALALIPYAIMSMLSGYIIYLYLRKRFFLNYKDVYIATLLATIFLNLIVLGCLYASIYSVQIFGIKNIYSLITPLIVVLIGIILAILFSALVFNRAIKRKVNFRYSVQYVCLIIGPVNILCIILPLWLIILFFAKKYNMPFLNFQNIFHQLKSLNAK